MNSMTVNFLKYHNYIIILCTYLDNPTKKNYKIDVMKIFKKLKDFQYIYFSII